jgi:hypothetical protein
MAAMWLAVMLAADARAEAPEAIAARQRAAEPAVRPMLGVGLTAGGGRETITYVDRNTGDFLREEYVKFGQLWQVYGGVELRVAPRFTVQGTLNYHTDNSSDRGGLFRFSRYPLELLGHYHHTDEWRFGGGVRLVKRARFKSSGENLLSAPVDVKFEDTTGLVLETEYRVHPALGLKLRYVAEKYEVAPGSAGLPSGDKFDGNHVGVLLTWYMY